MALLYNIVANKVAICLGRRRRRPFLPLLLLHYKIEKENKLISQNWLLHQAKRIRAFRGKNKNKNLFGP
jgi:predicted restriction endonuclease